MGISGKEKAKLQQVGPYIYEIEAEHEILEIFQNNITYQNKRIFKFSRTLTDSSLDPESDIILHLNLPKIETMALGKGISFIANSLKILGIVKDIKYLFIRSSVNELLWGREYDLLNMMKKSKLIKYINHDKIDGKFGLMYGMNYTYETQPKYKYTIDNGAQDFKQLLTILDVDRQGLNIKCWKNDKIAKIYGTDLEQVSPYTYTNKDILPIFIEDFYRTVNYKFSKAHNLKIQNYPQIPVRRFEQYEETFNGQFCSNGDCRFVDQGILNIGNCRNLHFPLLVSSPYFHNTKNDYLSEIEILNKIPKQSNINSYLDIEPTSGVVMSSRFRHQISASLDFYKTKNWSVINDLKSKTIPIMWLEIEYEAPDSIKKQISTQLITGTNFIHYLPLIIFIIALVLILLGYIYRKRNIKILRIISLLENKRLLENSQDRPVLLDTDDEPFEPNTFEKI